MVFEKLTDTIELSTKVFKNFTSEYTSKLAWVLSYRTEMKELVTKIRLECNNEMERQQIIYEENLAQVVR